jgi:hypothetical protein
MGKMRKAHKIVVRKFEGKRLNLKPLQRIGYEGLTGLN